jgi:signal transduction histidine kinase
MPYDVGAVLVRAGDGGNLVPLSVVGAATVGWDADLNAEGPFTDAWLTQEPQLTRLRDGALGPVQQQLVVPLRTGVRTYALLGLERHEAFPAAEVASAQRLADAVAIRLDTALLFDEVRGLAVAEERRRLAREIHDGVAQEVASLGYLVDHLTSSTDEEHTRRGLRELREELTRIVSELRLSIFDLRSEVNVHAGLGAALSEYVRSVGAQSSHVVHLALDETGRRLPVEIEAELLRLAQEAITNARKHSGGRNIWVSCAVRPPHARLVVEDDGVGPSRVRRTGGYGMDIMQERADRLRARLSIAPRTPQGTIVEVQLGPETPLPAELDRRSQPA